MENEQRERIRERLERLEHEEGVRIIHACESGSRAWGFPSRDSDYDVRFIYVRRHHWYLSIDAAVARDVIELPIDDILDINGWDLPKALRLLRKSNPPLLEWLCSPIVYRAHAPLVERLRAMVPVYYSPRACAYHYLHMAEGNSRAYLQGKTVSLKKYFYVLRPLLAIRWIEEDRGVAPIEFQRLVETMLEPGELRDAIEHLRQKKLEDVELGTGPRIPAISSFIESELARHANGLRVARTPERESDDLNALFREAIEAAWSHPPAEA
ncbi:MAG TPA: nucleotidyltransferase domain-containing protein [Candidatus Kapabacteria bacterium]|nr:nucleotidyltransferase domain-containing protein [Candidatus Kapabacteria bacterium]